MNHFSKTLLPILKEAGTREDGTPEYVLFHALEDSRPRFLAFLDLAPPSINERREVESGTLPSSRGGVTLFSTNFKQGVLSLSNALHASERFCATLLEDNITDVTQPVDETTVQSAILSYHQERVALLRCLRLIFELATRSDATPSRSREFLQRYMFDMLKGPYKLGSEVGAATGTLAAKLLFEIDATKRKIEGQPQITADDIASRWSKAIKQALYESRHQLGHLLYLVAAAGQLQAQDLTSLVRWLSKVPPANDSLSVYILTTVMEAMTPNENEDEDDNEVPAAFSDPKVFVDLSSMLNPSWANADIRSVMLLQYSLFHLEFRSQDIHVRGDVSVIEDEVGASLKKAVNEGAFQALSRVLLRSRDTPLTSDQPEFSLGADDAIVSGHIAPIDLSRVERVIPHDFRVYLLDAVNKLISGLIRRLSRTLRDIRKQEEDVAHGVRPPRPLAGTAITSSTSIAAKSSRNIEGLFRLIAILFDEYPPETALQFWADGDGGRYTPFLRWAAESRQAGTIVGMLDMLMSLAKGQSCATFAYNFLSTGGGQFASSTTDESYASAGSISWSTLFMALHHYESKLPHSHVGPSHSGPGSGAGIGAPTAAVGAGPARFALEPDEMTMLSSYLRVLRNVARYSPAARFALYENRDFRAVHSMFNLASHSVPLELKAMLFDALSAFAAPNGGAMAVDLVHQIWNNLERMEIVPVRGPAGSVTARTTRPVGGAVIELEVVETGGKTYPATLAFLQLLNSLIHTPQKSLTLRKGVEAESRTIPLNLGAGYRMPGLKPYVDFVVERVFVKLFTREYIFPEEQWQLMDRCLCFMEKSLASFDLSILSGLSPSSWNTGSIDRPKLVSNLTSLATHPGFYVLKSILAQREVCQNMLYVVDGGFSTAFNQLRFSFPRSKAVLRSLRIISRVLQIQGIFGEILVPLLNEIGDIPGIGSAGFPVSSLLPLDTRVLQAPHTIPNIALYLTVDDPQFAMFVIQTLRSLNDHPNFPWTGPLDPLVAAIDSSPHRDRIISACVGWLGADAAEVSDDMAVAGTNDGDHIASDVSIGDVRQTLVDFMVYSTRLTVRGYNFAHLLLGFRYGTRGELTLDGTSSPACLDSITSLLNRGLENIPTIEDPLFLQTHPFLAERCLQLIHNLCVHPMSATVAERSLRSRDQLFMRQLHALPVRIPRIVDPHSGRVSSVDGMSVETTAAAFASALRIQSIILNCLALEVRVLNETRQHSRLETLIDNLFGASQTGGLQEDEAHIPGQSLTRILHLLDSFLLEWHDPTEITPTTLRLFAGIDWEAAQQSDDHGCIIYDQHALIAILREARIGLQRDGTLSSVGAEHDLRLETSFVMKTAARENDLREIAFAKSSGLAAWSSLLEVLLTNGFLSIRADRREAILHDLLSALPQHLGSALPHTTSLLSSTLLLLATKLREALLEQTLATHSTLAMVPAERLYAHLKNILECTLQQGTTERTRGNLYAALIKYLQIVQDVDHFKVEVAPRDLGSSEGDLPLVDHPNLTPFHIGTLKIVNVVADKFVPMVCRDAIDGSEIWRTVAYALLGSLIRLGKQEKSQKVLGAIVKGGFLQTIVASLKESSRDLARLLQNDEGSLNALYVFEAKMTMLLRLAEYKVGAERLIESRVFTPLLSFEILESAPPLIGANTSERLLSYRLCSPNIDFPKAPTGFIPTTLERYFQIIIPALQLSIACLSAGGASKSAVARLVGCSLVVSVLPLTTNFSLSRLLISLLPIAKHLLLS
ncbi:hypothetical protein DL93DRAFT_2120780 [Clavulina sp. PMI_390]|nr:hypothetical protein DL93DRAFT_2120780 [Clavulina sp. PMI_390]